MLDVTEEGKIQKYFQTIKVIKAESPYYRNIVTFVLGFDSELFQ